MIKNKKTGKVTPGRFYLSANGKGLTTIELIAIAAVLSVFAFLVVQIPERTTQEMEIACTMEAKQCPDGSFVGRTGPNCEFADCPSAPALILGNQNETAARSASEVEGTLSGTITIGPICPVETFPPDPRCAPSAEAYAARKVFVYSADRLELIATLVPDSEGKFSGKLAEGSYVIDVQRDPIGGVTGAPAVVNVNSGETVTIQIDIDTGIR